MYVYQSVSVCVRVCVYVCTCVCGGRHIYIGVHCLQLKLMIMMKLQARRPAKTSTMALYISTILILSLVLCGGNSVP